MSRLLVVDDDPSILEVVKIVLEDEGFEVMTNEGMDVWAVISTTPPDFVLLDVWLPGQDGRQIGRRLKHQWPRLPVVLMSAHSDLEAAAKEAGADGFLEKPFDLSDLVVMVKHFV